MTELSIVIPTLQRAELLERCLYSVERGTQCSFEIVVVDGASTDDTGAVLNRARQRLGDRLQIIREEQREGCATPPSGCGSEGAASLRGRHGRTRHDRYGE